MSLGSILNHIIGEADKEKNNIIQQAQQQAEAIIQQAQQQADGIYKEIINAEKSLLEKEKKKLVVNSNLESKKKLLKSKQEMIDAVFEKLKSTLKKDRLKKQQIFKNRIEEVAADIDFYLDRIRLDNEAELAKIFFPDGEK